MVNLIYMNKSKIAALVSLVLLFTAFIDTYFELMQAAGLSLELINQIKLFGLAVSVLLPGVAALFTKKTD
jgi:hypothetical protein